MLAPAVNPGTSFVIPVTSEEGKSPENTSKSPRVTRKIESGWEDVRNFRESLSSDDLTAKLDAAAQRKKDAVDSRAAKAANFVAKAKVAAQELQEQEQRRTTESAERLNSKLSSAQENREEHERLIRQRLHEHSEIVESRRSNSNLTTEELMSVTGQRLEAAEARRLELEAEQKERLAAHEKHAQEVRLRKAAQESKDGSNDSN